MHRRRGKNRIKQQQSINNASYLSSFRSRRSSQSSATHVNTRSPIGSWTDKKISLMVNMPNWHHHWWTQNCVKIWSDSRRSVPIVVCVITGVFVYAVNIQKQLVVVDAQSVCQRRSKQLLHPMSIYQLLTVDHGVFSSYFAGWNGYSNINFQVKH